MYRCRYINIYMYIYICIYVCVLVCSFTDRYIYTYVCVYLHVHVHLLWLNKEPKPLSRGTVREVVGCLSLPGPKGSVGIPFGSNTKPHFPPYLQLPMSLLVKAQGRKALVAL